MRRLAVNAAIAFMGLALLAGCGVNARIISGNAIASFVNALAGDLADSLSPMGEG
jgi:hypothetical protein